MADWKPETLARASRLFLDAAAPAPAPEKGGAPREKFVLLERVGEGASSVVFRARDEDLGRQVAIKLLRPELRAQPGMAARFQEEFRALARIRHPNVVEIFEVGAMDSVPFAALEWMDGPVPPGPLAEEEALSIALAAAKALEAVHEAGLVHSDVKPANLLRRSGPGRAVVKLADFGVARELLGARPASGTPAFMAPEQAAGAASEIDHRTDIYNLGATLLALLTGEPPHASLAEAREGTVALPPGLSRPVRALLAKALAPARKDRHASATELRRDLERAARPGRLPRALAALGVLVVLAVVLAIILVATLAPGRAGREPAPPPEKPPAPAVPDARSDVRRVFDSVPFNKRTLAPLGDAARRLGVKDELLALFTDKDGDIEKALALLEGESRSADRVFLRAFAHHVHEDAAEAVKDHELALRLDASWPELWIYAGYARISAGDAKGAAASADRALVLGAREVEALALRGAARLASSEYALAAADLETARAKDPARLAVLHDLAMAEIGLGRFEKAQARLADLEDDPAIVYARALAAQTAPPEERLASLIAAARVAAQYKDVSSPDRFDEVEWSGHRPFVLWTLSYQRIEAEVDLAPLKKLPGFRRLASLLRDR